MTDDLEVRISDVLTRVAESADLAAPTRADIATLAGRRRQRRRVRTALYAAAAATLVVAGAVAALDHDPGPRTVTGDEPPTAPSPPAPPTAPPTAPSTSAAPAPGTTEASAPPAPPSAGAAAPSPTAATSQGPAGTGAISALTVRPDGVGPYDFGTPFDEVVAGLTAELGQPDFRGTGADGSCDSALRAGLPAYGSAHWAPFTVEFLGKDTGSLELVGWYANQASPSQQAAHVEGGPTIGAPLSQWRTAFGSALVVGQADQYGDVPFTVHLPAGDISGTQKPDGGGQIVRAGSDCTFYPM